MTGPGIPDIRQALRDGYSTSGSLGLGLPGVRRLMDEFEITSELGPGNDVAVKKLETIKQPMVEYGVAKFGSCRGAKASQATYTWYAATTGNSDCGDRWIGPAKKLQLIQDCGCAAEKLG